MEEHHTIHQPVGVGMPAYLKLWEFGEQVQRVFGKYPRLVGSSIKHKNPRDIDVRLVFSKEDEGKFFHFVWGMRRAGTAWSAMCMAFSAYGKEMTGLNIDFQIMIESQAAKYKYEPFVELGGTNPETVHYTDPNAASGSSQCTKTPSTTCAGGCIIPEPSVPQPTAPAPATAYPELPADLK